MNAYNRIIIPVGREDEKIHEKHQYKPRKNKIAYQVGIIPDTEMRPGIQVILFR